MSSDYVSWHFYLELLLTFPNLSLDIPENSRIDHPFRPIRINFLLDVGYLSMWLILLLDYLVKIIL